MFPTNIKSSLKYEVSYYENIKITKKTTYLGKCIDFYHL